MNIAVFEDSGHRQLLPLTWLRACFELRCGHDTLLDKIRTHAPAPVVRLYVRQMIDDVVRERHDLPDPSNGEPWCLLNARVLAIGSFKLPQPGAAWRRNGTLLAATVSAGEIASIDRTMFQEPDRLREFAERFRTETVPDAIRLISYPWDLVGANAEEIRRQSRAGGTQDGRIHSGAHLLDAGAIHIGRGAVIKPGAVLDASDGPIHIEREAVIEPNAVLQGPCYIGAGTIIRPGAVIREGTTIGPVCRVGGEIEETIFQGYSNKQHDGFLGHTYVGEWVNLGADTLNSDLKNTYGTIRVSLNGVPTETGQRFVGSFIGDHTKTGIGTILPTGCVLGVASNVFTQSRVPKFVPSFAWLTDDGMAEFRIDRAIEIARTVMGRRNRHLSAAAAELLKATAESAREVEKAGVPAEPRP